LILQLVGWCKNEGAWMSDFARLLEAEIPRLRRYARALTRDVTRADDLVQSCLARAVAKQHLWQPGTDLRAWLFTLLHNQHVNDVRRSVREGNNVSIEDAAPVLTIRANAIDALQLRDLERAIGKLAPEQRQVILLVGLEGMRYDEVASILDIPIGTVRSRLSRGREQLRILMSMDDEVSALPSVTSFRPTYRCTPIPATPCWSAHRSGSKEAHDVEIRFFPAPSCYSGRAAPDWRRFGFGGGARRRQQRRQ
jgi:RNA polymerase sigma-70 factor (ECF subfamily)